MWVRVLSLTLVTLMVVPTAVAPAIGAAPSGPLSVADVVSSSSFSGTVSSQSGAHGCGDDFLTFTGSYPGNTAVGTVNLNVAGCFDSNANSFSGSFTITTGVGTLSGSASGPVVITYSSSSPRVVTPVSDNFELRLSVTAGTGSFAGATGTLQTLLDTPYNNFASSFEGTVTDFFTQILVPQAGIISGVTDLDAGAYDAPGAITKVVFEVNGQVVATATPTYYGWLAKWNTTTSIASGIYNLVSVATNSDGNTATSFPVQIQVNNPPPTSTILIPSNGATLSGTSAVLDATASSPDGAPISVKFTGSAALNGVFGSLGTATPTLYGYIFVWNTTSVPNGTYTLQSLVTDVAGNFEYSTGISVTVANPTPTTAVVIPSGGASVSGTSSLLDARASANVTYVAFELSGGTINGEQLIATATPTYYGWLAEWNTTSVPNGIYKIQSVASFSRYFSGGTSAPVTITVAN
jgi:Bacterial Ig domain